LNHPQEAYFKSSSSKHLIAWPNGVDIALKLFTRRRTYARAAREPVDRQGVDLMANASASRLRSGSRCDDSTPSAPSVQRAAVLLSSDGQHAFAKVISHAASNNAENEVTADGMTNSPTTMSWARMIS
jgi:hypothetical protein